MALSHIRTVRRAGHKPAVVTVLIADSAPAWLDDGPLLVRVGSNTNPAAMDWTPLMGVWVTVHWLEGNKALAHGVVKALEAVGAKLFGASGPGFAVSLTANRSSEEAQVVRLEREALCAK